MTGAPSYIDSCAETINAIKQVDITRLAIGKRIGSGGRSAMHALGEVELEQASLFLGVKFPAASDRKRLEFELSAMDVVGTKIPAFIPKFPAFVGYIALDQLSNPVALLTEDVTAGGTLPIFPTNPSVETKGLFKDGFSGGEKGTLKSGEGMDHIAFNVGGTERFLDFTPPPIDWGSYEEGSLEQLRHQRYKRVAEMLPDLTIIIPSQSPLGQSISDQVNK